MELNPPTYYLNIGELIVSQCPAIISTILGSCVSVCLYSKDFSVGGIIHYALPYAPSDVKHEESFRYGDLAIVGLIEELTRVTRQDPGQFSAKIAGGAGDIGENLVHIQAGPQNIEVARVLLAHYGIPLMGEDVGGPSGRRILFHIPSGRLQVSSVNKTNDSHAVRTFGELNLRTVLAIGASTGGTEALKNVMCALPKEIPPTLIVQHIPSSFSRAFADRLNELCPFEVKEAEDGDELRASRVLIAPGGKQMKVQLRSDGLCVRITDDAPINRHKPSVDYLFQSIASVIGSKAVGVLLTGMGADGANGLLQMRLKGAKTIAQDEESSVVYGMPRIAFQMGAVEKVAPLAEIPRLILKAIEKKKLA